MQRRTFAKASFSLAAATTSGALLTRGIAAQTPDASPSASPSASPAVAGVWESAEEAVTIEYDAEIFGEASTSGVTGEWCVLQVPDIDRHMAVIIKLEEDQPATEDEARDYIENDEQLEYNAGNTPIERVEVVEGNGAFGALFTAENEAAPDTWGYTESFPAVDADHRPVVINITSRRSKLDRELHEAALNSLMINGEPAIRAIDVADLMDLVEAIEAPEAE